MTSTKRLIERFVLLPRAARWLVIGGLGIGAYFAVVEPVLDATAKLDAQCATKLARLAAVSRDHVMDSSVESDVKLGVQRYGLVSMPGAPKDRSDALNRRIAQVLMSHNVRDVTTTVKETPLSGNALARELSAAGTGAATGIGGDSGTDIRVDRLVTELQFEASPETVAAVVADLERSPEIATISRLQVRRATAANGGGNGGSNGGSGGVNANGSKSSGPRLVKAIVAAEAWQTVRKGRSR